MLKELFIPTKKNHYYPYLIRKPALSVYTLLLFLFNMFAGFLFPDLNSTVAASSITASTLISLTNQERQSSGLSTLKTNSKLTSAALAKANDMLEKDYWDHFGPNGETPWQFITGAGYTYVYAGENLAKGFSTSEGVHQAWMASPTHRANIMNSNYKDIGIAVVNGELQGEQTTLVVQMFGAQSTSSGGSGGTGGSDTGSSGDSGNDSSNDNSQNEVDTTPAPEVETGEIKSISITAPKNNTVITDPTLDIKGEVDVVEEVVGSYTVKIIREDTEIASGKSSTEKWSVDKKSDWEEGDQVIIAQVKQDGETFKDSVKFKVDSRPPIFMEESFTAVFDIVTDSWDVSMIISEENATAVLTAGSESYPLVDAEDGMWRVSVPDASIDASDAVYLILTDQYGNQLEEEILSEFVKPAVHSSSDSKNADGTAELKNQEKIDPKTLVNLGFGSFVVSMIGVQLYFYRKYKMLGDKGGYLFTVGIWGLLIIVGSLSGRIGDII